MDEENKKEFENLDGNTESEEFEKKEEKKINVAEAKEKFAEVKEKIGDGISQIKDKFEYQNTPKETIKPLVSSRILFISALDKILFIILLLSFLGATLMNITNSYATFKEIVFTEIGIIFGIFISYLFLNWLYKCAAKTMLCLTKNEVYLEMHAPFLNNETSIPLNKITGVTTINYFWIFRTIIIHQYGKLPVIFATWNNQEFKDKLNELITTDKGKVENEYQNRNILSQKNKKLVKYLGLGLVVVLVLVGLGRAFKFMTSPARNIPGTYIYDDEAIVFKATGTCNIDDIEDDVIECTWEYLEDSSRVRVDYKYRYYSYYSGSTTRSDYFSLSYNKDNKTLSYGGTTYTKKK